MGRKGLVLVFTGRGKGKTTAALGTILRACGHGMRCALIQFIKAESRTGEVKCLRERFPEVEVHQMGLGFLPEGGELEPHREAARKAWERAKELIGSEKFDLVVLDEINFALQRGLLRTEEVADFLQNYRGRAHLILTGRGAPRAVVEAADLVTEMCEIKHYFAQGIEAVKGLDW